MARERARKHDMTGEVERLKRRVAELEALHEERLRTEAALRESEARARAFFESAAEGVLLIRSDGTIVAANARLAELFGYARGEVDGQPVELLIPGLGRERSPGLAAGLADGGGRPPRGRRLDVRARRKDGTEFPAAMTVSPVESEDGPRVVAFVTDAGEQLALERAARQAERLAALGTFSAGIAHEINNPIGIITSRIEVMLLEAEDRGLSPDLLLDLRVLQRNAMRVARIAESFLSFARRAPTEREPVYLARVIADTLALVERQIRNQGIRIVTRLDAALPPVSGQASALEQVLLNLLTNARDAMPKGGEIRIETYMAPGRGDRVALKVSDTGPGIPDEALPRIFDPFYTTKPSGTGLGLSVTYGIVKDHSGTVDVQSTVGEGTSFVLTFPVMESPPPTGPLA
jgi:PAS domain S-box-containing protein